MIKRMIVIDEDDAKQYKESLLAVRKRLISAFEESSDMSLRKWINKHGPVLDELLEELGYRGKL